MAKTTPLLERVLDRLMPHGPIRARALFGGHGIYYGDLIFALIYEGELYFRVGDTNRADYEKMGSKPFVYDGGKKPIQMPYWTLPEEIFGNPKKLKSWIEKAHGAALLARQKKK